MLGSRGASVAMTTHDRKLVSYPDEGSSEGYDPLHDIGEHEILPRSDRVYREVESLASWQRSLEPIPGAERPPTQQQPAQLPAAVTQRLEALGYLEQAR
jgi:hypothetical protein